MKILVLLVVICNSLATNILFLNDLPSASHGIWNNILAKALAKRGHNVTTLAPNWTESYEDLHVEDTETYHSIYFEGVYKMTQETDFSLWVNDNELYLIKDFMDNSLAFCSHIYKTKGMKKLWNYPDDFKFDLIVVDMSVGTCMYPFIDRFGYPPTIGVTPFLLPPFLSEIFGNEIHPAYLPFYLSRYTENMNFWQRLWNYILLKVDVASRKLYTYPTVEKMAHQRFNREFDFGKIHTHVSLLFANQDPLLDYSQPLTPNIIPVGGLHLKPAEEIHSALNIELNKAVSGVVIVSLGTNIRSENLDAKKLKAMAEAFGKLNQTVIWKFDGQGTDFDFPQNIIRLRWMSQNDILAHPNVKLLVTHGGALSTQEAVYHGIPIVGIPFFVDQHVNVRRMVERKLGLMVDYKNLTAQTLYDAMIQGMYNPIYSENMKQMSERFKDKPQTPLKKAIFWTEYALRHKGAHFLSPKSRDMSYFVSSSTDVILFLSFILIFVTVLVYLAIFVCLCNKTCKHVQNNKIKNNKKD